MNCQQLRSGDLLEDYLLNRLPEAEREAVELHTFECAACSEELRLLAAMRQVLAEEPASKSSAGNRWLWMGLAAAAAAVLLLAPHQAHPPRRVAAVPHMAAPAPAAETLRELARARPPLYTPPVLRGAQSRAAAEFSAAMLKYAAGDFQGAIPGLRKASETEPTAPAPVFYLGICLLATGEEEAAVQPLRTAASLGDEAFTENARFYLAKAWLALGKTQDARQALEGVAGLHGDLEHEARRMLAELDRLSAQH